MQPAYVKTGKSVLTQRGIAHEGAKLSWVDMEGKTQATKKATFKKLIAANVLERIPAPGELQAAAAAGQIQFESAGEDSGSEDSGSEDSGSEDSGSEDSGSEDSGSEDSGSKDSGSKDSGFKDSDVKKLVEKPSERKSGAKRKKR